MTTTTSDIDILRLPTWLLAIICTLMMWLAGCWRDSPPEIQEFRPPAAHVEEAPATQPTTQPSTAVVEAPKVEEAPEAKPQVVKAAATAEAAPVAEPVKEATKAPTIIGTWRLTSVTHGGRQENIPPGMEMKLTFAEDGTTTMSMSMQGQSRDETGSYTLEGKQITMTQRGKTQTGTITFSGNDDMTLEMQDGGDQATITFTRA